MDYFLMSYKLKANNFSLYKLSNDKIVISKNESGTYSEFNDYEINIVINETTGVILYWNINPNNNKNELIEKLLREAVINKWTIDIVCDKLCEY